MKIELSFHNRYYPWTEISTDDVTCWLKGMLFYENKLLPSVDIIRLFSSVIEDSHIDYDSLKTLLLGLNGNFAFALETPRYVFCTVDHVRSVPLFYAVDEDGALFSDDANYLRDRLDPPFNEENGAEFLVAGYVTGPDTLFDGISQLQAGEYLVYDKKDGTLVTHFYHRFWHGDFFSESEGDLLNQLDEIFVRIFQRLIESTKGRQIVVPLSGGLDSRIIVAMLKRLGVENVICFTYGKKGNRESEISRRVAEALGYKWYFVEYTNEKWYACARTDDMKVYLSYAGNLSSIPVITNFLALKELKKNGKINENAVFVPGHQGMVAGGLMHRGVLAGCPVDNVDESIRYNLGMFQEDIAKNYYRLWDWHKTTRIVDLLNRKIHMNIDYMMINSLEEYADALEFFEFKERKSKFIINSVRAYEFFSYGWKLPLLDAELIDFFLKVPLALRIKHKLYRDYATKKLFVDSFEILRILDCTTDLIDCTRRNSVFSTGSFFLNNVPLLRRIGEKVYSLWRVHTEYDAHHLAIYGILPKDCFLRMYSGKENFHSFVGAIYLRNACPLLADVVIENACGELEEMPNV